MEAWMHGCMDAWTWLVGLQSGARSPKARRRCVIQVTPSLVRQVPVLVAQCFPRPRGMKRQEPTSTAQCTGHEVPRIS